MNDNMFLKYNYDDLLIKYYDLFLQKFAYCANLKHFHFAKFNK